MTLFLGFLVALFASGALATISAIAVSNARRFPRLRLSTENDKGKAIASAGYAKQPEICILIPARNEAGGIAQTVISLLTQDYPGLHLFVLDDHSDDGTAACAETAARTAACLRPAAPQTEDAPNTVPQQPSAPTFQLLHGKPLPPGWLGKNWACQQLADAATEALPAVPVLIFADADVCWEPGAVRALADELQHSGGDLLTIWPTQTTVTWGERLTVPLMALAVLGYLPLRLAHDFYHPLAAAANGQCMAFRRDAYTAVGGHASVRGVVVEDVRLAQRIKAAGRKLRMADGNRLIRCRMYDGWQAAIDGYAKNILAGHGNHVALLLLSTLFHWVVFVWPWAWLLFGGNWGLPLWPLWPLALVLLGVGARAVTAAATHQRIGDALLMPLSVLLMTYVALRATWWRWRFGGVVWKGRILRDA